MDILIDFDGTVVAHEFPKVGRDIGAVPVLKELVGKGHNLILFTMRSNSTNNSGYSDEVREVLNGNFLDDAVEWFRRNEIPLYGVQANPNQKDWTTSPKAYGQLIIDDTCLGIPLVYSDPVLRPYVDWDKVRIMLVGKRII